MIENNHIACTNVDYFRLAKNQIFGATVSAAVAGAGFATSITTYMHGGSLLDPEAPISHIITVFGASIVGLAGIASLCAFNASIVYRLSDMGNPRWKTDHPHP